MFSTEYYPVEAGNNPGVYCSYCSKRITPLNDEGNIVFRCDCEDATTELSIRNQLLAFKQTLDEVISMTSSKEAHIARLQVMKIAAQEDCQKIQAELKLLLIDDTGETKVNE